MLYLMLQFNPNPEIPARVLATDLDGTFIPLPATPENRRALSTFHQAQIQRQISLIYATGRHLESVLDVMGEHGLPEPDWIICDVGTSIHQRQNGTYAAFAPYEIFLAEQTHDIDRAAVESTLKPIAGLTLQPPECQQRFKISYITAARDVESLAALATQCLVAAGLPYAALASLNPFHNEGLLDILPLGTSKATALIWLATHADFSPDEVVFAGDSGNDLAALTCGFRAIVVANAAEGLADRVEDVLATHGHAQRFFRATLPATSGVLQGCRHFQLLKGASPFR